MTPATLGLSAARDSTIRRTGPGRRPAASAIRRLDHTATLLPNGKVLVAGGLSYNFDSPFTLASAELYDPASGTWTATGSLATARYLHTATLLPNGKVLVAGGYFGGIYSPLASAELYDPASGTWTATGSLVTARAITRRRCCPTARCSLSGGHDGGSVLASAELYDPASESWTATGSLATARYRHTATLLPNGKVLVAGGYIGGTDAESWLDSAELYDPASGTWTATGDLLTRRANSHGDVAAQRRGSCRRRLWRQWRSPECRTVRRASNTAYLAQHCHAYARSYR